MLVKLQGSLSNSEIVTKTEKFNSIIDLKQVRRFHNTTLTLILVPLFTFLFAISYNRNSVNRMWFDSVLNG